MKTIAHFPLLFFDLFESERFVRQNLRDIDKLTTPLNLTVVSHVPHDRFGIVLYGQYFLWINPCRGVVNTGWSFSFQRLMMTLAIVLLLEQIKVVLLALVGWLGCNLTLKGPVHSFMASILAGLARLNSFRADAQLNPPLRQLTNPTDGERGKGRTVVSADRSRQSILTKGPLKPGPDRGITRMFQSPAQQKVAREVVGQSQRIAAAVVGQSKVSFEIRAPDLIGILARAERFAV